MIEGKPVGATTKKKKVENRHEKNIFEKQVRERNHLISEVGAPKEKIVQDQELLLTSLQRNSDYDDREYVYY